MKNTGSKLSRAAAREKVSRNKDSQKYNWKKKK